jgi:HlyD family secretion protein
MRPTLTVLLLLMLTACHQTEQKIHGYVEGEFVMIAPTSSGLLQSLQVKRGQTVIRGQKLFALDLTELTAQRDSAVASVQLAQANLNDLLKGQRPQELNIILEQKQQALANYANAEKEYQRNIPLAAAKAISQLELDNTKFAYLNAKARIAELEAQIKTAKLGARIDKVEAANASIEIAKENLAQIEKKILDASPTSPAAGIIQDTYFQPGEYINIGQAVVNLLPPQNVKIRFFLAQKDIAQIKPNQVISFSCDGCKHSIPAKITYISSNAEYTPPVIYSVESRDKLVFMLEATPDTFHPELKPGLPVDIEVNH